MDEVKVVTGREELWKRAQDSVNCLFAPSCLHNYLHVTGGLYAKESKVGKVGKVGKVSGRRAGQL
jgi:hypothetical protein